MRLEPLIVYELIIWSCVTVALLLLRIELLKSDPSS